MEPKYKWPLINDNISEDDKKQLAEWVLSTNRFTNGPLVKEFEQVWSDWLGVNHSVMVNSGASANYISIAIAKSMKGVGEVIVPPIGWVSDIASVTNLGMTPVFVDVDLENMAITADNIEKAITPDTKAVVLVHALGFNGLTEKILELRDKYDFLLIEDCCESHGATYKDKKVGTYGDISVFSFYYGHHITTIEGGMVCTNEDSIYDLSKLFRSHGMTREASDSLKWFYEFHYPELNPLFTFAVPGFNMRSTEINAKLGLLQMNKLDRVVTKRSDNLKLWLSLLDSDKFYTDFDIEGNSNFALPLLLSPKTKFKIKEVQKILREERVEFRMGTAGGGNQARQPYLRDTYYRTQGELTHADFIHFYGLYVGNHEELTEDQIRDLVSKINKI